MERAYVSVPLRASDFYGRWPPYFLLSENLEAGLTFDITAKEWTNNLWKEGGFRKAGIRQVGFIESYLHIKRLEP